MRHLWIGILPLLLTAPTRAGTATLQEARHRWLRGNYEEARTVYLELAKDPKQRSAAALGLSQVEESRGEYDRALSGIEAALETDKDNADLQARRAELLFLRGRWEDAAQAATKALDRKKNHLLARWVLARGYRARGDLKRADAEFRWFVRTYTTRSDADQDIKDPDELLLVGLAGAENARWNNLSDQFQFILNDVYGDALKADKDFWPAEYQAGMLLLEKYNRAEAVAAFDKALAINPNATEALVGKGVAALQRFEIQDAERFAERALKVNPRLVEALHLQADIRLAGGDLAGAIADLDRARQVNPRDEATLARLAACFSLQGRSADVQSIVQEVAARDPKPGEFYLVLAEQLEDRRRYDEAETYYKKAAEPWPMLAAARGNLGLLYLRMGREPEARDLLEKAFAADGFNVRVANSLKVLHHLEKYETLQTPHFLIRFDPKADRQLAQYLAKYLETTYTELSERFHYSFREPILFEVFNNHEMFSGRTVALPDLHTVGACTGRMIAMASPRAKGVRKPFNWARVVRHELVHIFNLAQTRFRVPHWYTEGLAVQNEGFPRPQEWNQLLRERVPAGDLMNLQSVDLGFIRPRTPSDWAMAYCQSVLYVEYMTSKYGPQSVGELLDAYRDGLDTASALRKVCKVDAAAFERDYRDYLNEIVKSLKGRPAEKPRTLPQLQEAHERDPADLNVAAQLAEQFLLRRRTADARKLAEAVLAKKKGHPLASYVKARLLLSAGDDEQARAVLEAALGEEPLEPKVLLALGRVYFENKDFAKAAEIFELGRQAEPYENKWLTELVRTYAQAGDKEKQIGLLKEYLPTDADDLDARKQLAGLLLDAGRFAEAEGAGRQALEIDVLDAEAERTLGEALAGQQKWQEAIDAYRVALESKPQLAAARLKLAEAYLGIGDKNRAQAELTKLLAHDPENVEAKRLRDTIKP